MSDLSIEQVAVLAAQNDLPIPSLDVDAIVTSTSAITSPGMYRRDSGPVSSKRNAQPAFSDDPWTTPFPTTGEASGAGSLLNGAPSSLSGTGMPKDWWRRQERVQVRLLGPQGFILNRYMVYEVSTEVSAAIYFVISMPEVAWRSEVRLSNGDIPSLPSFGMCSFDGILSVYYHSCHQNV